MEKRASSRAFLWLNSLGKGGQEPERSLSTHLNPTCDSPAQVSYSGGSKMSLRGVFTDLVTLTHRPLGRQIHRYRIAFLVASVAMARVEVAGLHFFLSVTQSSRRHASAHESGRSAAWRRRRRRRRRRHRRTGKSRGRFRLFYRLQRSEVSPLDSRHKSHACKSAAVLKLYGGCLIIIKLLFNSRS